MRLTRRTVLGTVAGTAALSGCIGGENGSASPTSTTTDTATETVTSASTTAGGTSSQTVRVASHPDLGDVLVGPDGMTLYMFDQDTRGEGASSCYDSCAQTWPPLIVTGSPTKGGAVTAAVTTFERENGERQVTAGGWPLYYYAPDENPGEAKGQGVGGVWWVLAPDGTPVGRETATSGDGAD